MAEPSKTETVVYYDGGDVHFMSRQDPSKLFVCSSIILCNASPVFRGMFKDFFQEATKLGSTFKSPEPIKLDDPVKALQNLLGLTHSKSIKSSWPTTASELLELAVICDKYLCPDVGGLTIEFGIKGLDRKLLMDKACLAAAAAITGDAVRFRELTKALVLEHGCLIPLTQPVVSPFTQHGSYQLLRQQGEAKARLLPFRNPDKYHFGCGRCHAFSNKNVLNHVMEDFDNQLLTGTLLAAIGSISEVYNNARSDWSEDRYGRLSIGISTSACTTHRRRSHAMVAEHVADSKGAIEDEWEHAPGNIKRGNGLMFLYGGRRWA